MLKLIAILIDTKNACWGGLMSAGAQAKGVRGVIIDGRCRDIGEHREMGFPVGINARYYTQ